MGTGWDRYILYCRHGYDFGSVSSQILDFIQEKEIDIGL
jgi:hypothetical protein